MNDVNLKQKYQPIIDQLSQIYEAHEVINDYGDNPIAALTEYLETIPLLSHSSGDATPNLDLAIRTYVKRLNCFRWRFVNQNNAGDVWNPLFESFETFQSRAKQKIKHWYDDHPFPSEEIIENWIKSYVPEITQHAKKVSKKPARQS